MNIETVFLLNHIPKGGESIFFRTDIKTRDWQSSSAQRAYFVLKNVSASDICRKVITSSGKCNSFKKSASSMLWRQTYSRNLLRVADMPDFQSLAVLMQSYNNLWTANGVQ